MHIQRTDHTVLRDLNAVIDDMQDLRRDACSLVPEDQDEACREGVGLEGNGGAGLFDGQDSEAFLAASGEEVEEVGGWDRLDLQPLVACHADGFKLRIGKDGTIRDNQFSGPFQLIHAHSQAQLGLPRFLHKAVQPFGWEDFAHFVSSPIPSLTRYFYAEYHASFLLDRCVR
jgi:hypothetical protein